MACWASGTGSHGSRAVKKKSSRPATRRSWHGALDSLSCSLLDKRGDLIDIERSDWLEFYVVLVRETANPEKPPALTPRLFMLREGDRLHVGEKITGNFTLDPVKPEDAVVFLATGTGEAPAQLHALGTAAPQPSGPDPVRLLRALSSATSATAPFTTS